jgi:lipoate-protein ligase A
MLAAAFRRLGVDARVGEVPGEYCSGPHSVNARGLRKLAGIGQRVIRNAAHVGGVIVVARSDLVRSALLPVYEELGLPWDPETAGSLADELGAVTPEDVAAAVRTELEARFRLETGDEDLPLGAALVEASRLASRFEPDLHASSGAVVSQGGRRGKTVAEPG